MMPLKKMMMTMKRQKERSENIWKRWREFNRKKQLKSKLQMLIDKDKRSKWRLI